MDTYCTNQDPKIPSEMKVIRQSFAKAVVHGVAPDIRDLRPITLREIAKRVNYIHHDRVLFARVAHEPYRIIGTNALLEDTQGEYLFCGLYHYVMPSEDPVDVLPEGFLRSASCTIYAECERRQITSAHAAL